MVSGDKLLCQRVATSGTRSIRDPKNWRDASKETEEQYAERRRREDRIERLWNRRTLFETIQ
jgi:hypothetical protein